MPDPHIVADPAIMMGKPCISGTRISVEVILRKLGAGRSFAAILEAYPQLTDDDLRAVLKPDQDLTAALPATSPARG